MSDQHQRPGMSYNDIAMVLARALREREFRRALIADPKAAIDREYPEFSPGPATVEFFKSLGKEFGHAAETLQRARDPLRGAGDM